jgi:hypothetical protein
MSRLSPLGQFAIAISLVIVLAAAFGVLSVEDPRFMPLVQELIRSCSEFYQDNPSLAALLIASVIGIPAGYLIALIWPRQGLFSPLNGRRESR